MSGALNTQVEDSIIDLLAHEYFCTYIICPLFLQKVPEKHTMCHITSNKGFHLEVLYNSLSYLTIQCSIERKMFICFKQLVVTLVIFRFKVQKGIFTIICDQYHTRHNASMCVVCLLQYRRDMPYSKHLHSHRVQKSLNFLNGWPE